MSRPWSGNRPFVGRTDVRGALAREVDAVIRGSGRAVFLLGPAGSGQTACISVFQEEAFRRREALRAEYVDCAHSGTETWAELAEIFTRGHRLKRSAKKVVSRDPYVWATFRLMHAELVCLDNVPQAKQMVHECLETFGKLGTQPMIERADQLLARIGG